MWKFVSQWVDDPYTVLDDAAAAAPPLLPPAVSDAVARCLDEPQRRPVAVSELLAQLDDACATGAPAEAPPDGRLHVRVPPAVEQQLDVRPSASEVLALMAEGRTNRAIAEQLVITEHTDEKHVTSVIGKLQIPASADDHRRVLAVLTFLDSA
jgi:DNA-binding NarL/FixJ family response regulator